MITTFKLVASQTLWILQERCQRPFGNSACDAYMFYYRAFIFIVLDVINQNVDHFSLFFSKFVTITQITSADIAEICLGSHRAGAQALGAVICKRLNAAKGKLIHA